MIFAFDTKELRSICEHEAIARAELGDTVATALKHRLADLRDAETIYDLLVGNPKQEGDQGKMVVDLNGGGKLIFCANHPKVPKDGAAMMDWSRVTRIKILDIRGSQKNA